LAHIFCSEKAGIPIKSYSPEFIVHPYLQTSTEFDQETKLKIKIDGDYFDKIKVSYKAEVLASVSKWYSAIHSLIIGPGLGRDDIIAACLPELITRLKLDQISVFDADFFWYLTGHEIGEKLKAAIVNRAQMCIITPNITEFGRLWKHYLKDEKLSELKDIHAAISEIKITDNVLKTNIDHIIVRDAAKLAQNLNNLTILLKGEVDVITDGKEAYIVRQQGASKRCGGQGDILSGLVGLYSYWAYSASKNNNGNIKLLHGCILASIVSRFAARKAFEHERYGLVTPKILDQVANSINEVADILLNHNVLLENSKLFQFQSPVIKQ